MKILAVGAHPDDIEIGCGATLCKFAAQGHITGMVVCSHGTVYAGRPDTRVREQKDACSILGVSTDNLFFGTFLDAAIRHDRALVNFLETCLGIFEPDIFLTPWPDDTHQDHVAVARACLSAARRSYQILQYATLSSVNFEPTVWSDVEGFVEKKVAAIKAHDSQNTRIDVAGNSLSDLALINANYMGTQSRLFKQCEGFVPYRSSVDLFIPAVESLHLL